MTEQEEITKETFEIDYCRLSGISREYYNQWFVTLPCNCDYEGCRGWANVRHGDEEDHRRLYGN